MIQLFCDFSKAVHLMASGKQEELVALVLKCYPWSKCKHRILKLALLFLVGMAFLLLLWGLLPSCFPFGGFFIWLVGLFCLLRQAGFKLTFLVSFSCQHVTAENYLRVSPLIILARL